MRALRSTLSWIPYLHLYPMASHISFFENKALTLRSMHPRGVSTSSSDYSTNLTPVPSAWHYHPVLVPSGFINGVTGRGYLLFTLTFIQTIAPHLSFSALNSAINPPLSLRFRSSASLLSNKSENSFTLASATLVHCSNTTASTGVPPSFAI